MKSKIWLSSPHIGNNELGYVNEAFTTNWIAPLGPHVNSFEEGLQNLTQTIITYCVQSTFLLEKLIVRQ